MIVYIAGPLETGPSSVNDNVRRACQVAEWVRGEGHVPYVPHTSVLWDAMWPHPRDYWMGLCLEWVAVSDCVLRLPGESHGADAEVAEAKRLGIPVVLLDPAGEWRRAWPLWMRADEHAGLP